MPETPEERKAREAHWRTLTPEQQQAWIHYNYKPDDFPELMIDDGFSQTKSAQKRKKHSKGKGKQ